MLSKSHASLLLVCCALFFQVARAGTATGISGLYFTGVDNAGALLPSAPITSVQDSHWTVTYASLDGGKTQAWQHQGATYVVNPIDGGWTRNTSNAQWIVAPGATMANGTNIGGTNLPGNGTGNKMGVFLYTLEFYIAGKISDVVGSTVTNNLAISLTISADDRYRIYLNPANKGTGMPVGAPLASGDSAWHNTAPFTLSNFTNGSVTRNTDFVIGKNYLVVEVDNTNSLTGNSKTNPENPSGLLFFQNSSQWVTIGDGNFTLVGGRTVPIPEKGLLIPVAGVLGVLGLLRLRSRRKVANCK